MIIVKNRFSGKIIFKSKKKILKNALEFKVKQGADLKGAYLRRADLRGADLKGADLRVKKPPILSHQFISEILTRQSKTESQLDFSCRVGRQTDECWKYFIKLARKKRVLKWAMKILFQWDEFKQKYKEEQ
jgi:hypothetical protein